MITLSILPLLLLCLLWFWFGYSTKNMIDGIKKLEERIKENEGD